MSLGSPVANPKSGPDYSVFITNYFIFPILQTLYDIFTHHTLKDHHQLSSKAPLLVFNMAVSCLAVQTCCSWFGMFKQPKTRFGIKVTVT
jgi:hypothetical protein